tara:strand:- start:580 stop:744 length:165 start_codon:yes stop_codon:yes gene_type:complete
MASLQERLDAENKEFNELIEVFNNVASTQQEKLKQITIKEARIGLLKEQIADGE